MLTHGGSERSRDRKGAVYSNCENALTSPTFQESWLALKRGGIVSLDYVGGGRAFIAFALLTESGRLAIGKAIS
jgi:hypothetical protein